MFRFVKNGVEYHINLKRIKVIDCEGNNIVFIADNGEKFIFERKEKND